MPHALPPRTAAARVPVSASGHHWPVPLQETLKHSQARLSQSLVEITVQFPGSWCTQGFAGALQAPLASLRFDFKCYCDPPTIFLWLLLWPSMWVSSLGGLWHSSVYGCSATSFDFCVLTVERTSFYSIILWSCSTENSKFPFMKDPETQSMCIMSSPKIFLWMAYSHL